MPDTHRSNRSFRTIATLTLLILVGLLLRLWFLSVNELDPQLSPADDGDYYQRALRFATTGEYIDDFWLIRPPLHVFLFALMLRISILLGNVSGILLIRIAQIVLSLLAIPVGYGLASRLFGRGAGLVFAGLLAVWYPLVELPSHLFTEPLFFLLLLVHLWLLVFWRDTRRWYLLTGSGVFLGLTALTRSVAVYGAFFVVLWLIIEAWTNARAFRQHNTGDTDDGPEGPDSSGNESEPDQPSPSSPWLTPLRQWGARVARTVALFAIPCALVIVPWTIRNYVVYQRFILIDTIGSVNLWLHMEKYEAKGVDVLRELPQRDRQVFAVEDTKRMFFEDPLHFWNMLWRNAWLHFLHIWKGQFIEDFLLKTSFYGRPLREMWPLGMAGDLLWFLFTAGGLAAMAAPLREGSFRWIALCWIGYTMLTVMLFHVEPRYLMPLWLLLMLYSSWAFASPVGLVRLLRQHWRNGMLALLLVGSFLVLCFSYRNYPHTLAVGIQREWHRAAGVQAFAADDYDRAVGELRAAAQAQPFFVNSQAELALALTAQGRYDEAQKITGSDDAQYMLVARGAIARGRGEQEQASDLFTRAEKKSGEDVQEMTRTWLRPVPLSYLELGSGQDYGYIKGFSAPEETATTRAMAYRWLQGSGQVVLPLPEPLQPGSLVALRMAGGPGGTPLQVRFADGEGNRAALPEIFVAGERWRTFWLPVPTGFAGAQTLTVMLDAPIFIPAHEHPGSNDIRPVSLMLNAVWVRNGL
jgi:hypothetical protein